MFYNFDQNNSGGAFIYAADCGITKLVIIEADSAGEANARAVDIGIYFNGCDDETDCPCCGDRWHPVSGDGDDVPSRYGDPVGFHGSPLIQALVELKSGEFPQPRNREDIVAKGLGIAIHFKEGTILWVPEPEDSFKIW